MKNSLASVYAKIRLEHGGIPNKLEHARFIMRQAKEETEGELTSGDEAQDKNIGC